MHTFSDKAKIIWNLFELIFSDFLLKKLSHQKKFLKNSTRLGFRWLTKSIETIKLCKRSFSRCYSLCFYISMVKQNKLLSYNILPFNNFNLLFVFFKWHFNFVDHFVIFIKCPKGVFQSSSNCYRKFFAILSSTGLTHS